MRQQHVAQEIDSLPELPDGDLAGMQGEHELALQESAYRLDETFQFTGIGRDHGEVVKLEVLRVLLRVARDAKAIDLRKYVQIQLLIDEIGRMLGGWIRSVKDE